MVPGGAFRRGVWRSVNAASPPVMIPRLTTVPPTARLEAAARGSTLPSCSTTHRALVIGVVGVWSGCRVCFALADHAVVCLSVMASVVASSG